MTPRRNSGIADRVAALRPLALAELLLIGRQHGAVDLATGSPSFPDCGADLLGSASEALRGGNNQYADPAGSRELRAAAATLHGADPDTEITITAGATEGLAVTLQALVQPGDEVVVIEPYFEAYVPAIRLAGAQPRFVRLREPGWRWDPVELAAAFGPRTRAVIVNSPHNPTGRVFTASELSQVTRLCATWDSTLISDEVYVEFTDVPGAAVLPGAVEPAARVVALRSLSKSHAVSGWRIGWIYAPAELTRVFRMVHEVLVVGCAAPLQVAAAETLRTRPGWSGPERSALIQKRKRVHAAAAAAGLTGELPRGSAYLFLRLPPGAPPANDLARRLAIDCRLLTASGSLFFADPAAGRAYLRLACNKSDEVLDAAVERLAVAAPVLNAAALSAVSPRLEES
jgi:N-succinyldiaminopimelate aminotransferase